MRQNFRSRRRKVGGIVGAKTEVGARAGPPRNLGEKFGLHNPVFVMTPLRPRVREKDKDPLKAYVSRQYEEEIRGFGLNKGEIRELRPVPFSIGPLHPVADEIDADAKLTGMRLGIFREEMSVPGSHLPSDPGATHKHFFKPATKLVASMIAAGKVFGSAGGIVHAAG